MYRGPAVCGQAEGTSNTVYRICIPVNRKEEKTEDTSPSFCKDSSWKKLGIKPLITAQKLVTWPMGLAQADFIWG